MANKPANPNAVSGDAAEVQLPHVADVDAANASGKTSLQWAAQLDYPAVIQKLLGADVSARNEAVDMLLSGPQLTPSGSLGMRLGSTEWDICLLQGLLREGHPAAIAAAHVEERKASWEKAKAALKKTQEAARQQEELAAAKAEAEAWKAEAAALRAENAALRQQLQAGATQQQQQQP